MLVNAEVRRAPSFNADIFLDHVREIGGTIPGETELRDLRLMPKHLSSIARQQVREGRFAQGLAKTPPKWIELWNATQPNTERAFLSTILNMAMDLGYKTVLELRVATAKKIESKAREKGLVFLGTERANFMSKFLKAKEESP